MSDGTTYVLGWDGLDYSLCDEFGLADDFVPYHTRAETLDNEILGKPDTYELWPSIITGETPETHGVRLVSENGGAGAENFLINAATGFLHRRLSTEQRVKIAVRLRNRGLRLDQKTPSWYRKRGVSTVFDGRGSRVIGLPNYRTKKDEGLELFDGWGKKASEFLKLEADAEERKVVYRPRTSLERLEDWLVSEVGGKERVVHTASDRGYDLVFVWFAYIDTVGHTAPAVEDEGWQRRAYENAVEVTRSLRESMDDEDTLVVASDHGNRDADHTHDAFFGSTDERAVESVGSVLDYRAGIESVMNGSRSADEDGAYEIEVKYDGNGRR
ncbi:MAG: alkaline phosphatase family protein [Halobacteriales archaeon]|nr:alkaline phosphatase family protein [Halobacteriales archaeon]